MFENLQKQPYLFYSFVLFLLNINLPIDFQKWKYYQEITPYTTFLILSTLSFLIGIAQLSNYFTNQNQNTNKQQLTKEDFQSVLPKVKLIQSEIKKIDKSEWQLKVLRNAIGSVPDSWIIDNETANKIGVAISEKYEQLKANLNFDEDTDFITLLLYTHLFAINSGKQIRDSGLSQKLNGLSQKKDFAAGLIAGFIRSQIDSDNQKINQAESIKQVRNRLFSTMILQLGSLKIPQSYN